NGKPWAYAARKRAVNDALRRRRIAGACMDRSHDFHCTRFDLIGSPLITLIVLLNRGFADESPYQASADHLALDLLHLARHTAYRAFEIVLVGPPALSAAVAAQMEANAGVPVLAAPCESPDPGVAVNAGAALARGAHIVVMSSDLEPRDEDWLGSMLE